MKHPQPIRSDKDQFFQVRKEKREYFGNRFFRFNHFEEKAIQVCLMPGDLVYKSGKHTSIGVYTIGRLSFLSNYFAMGYVELITKKEYEEQFDNVVRILS